MNSSWKQTIRVMVIALLIGGASGVVTAAYTSGYLTQYSSELEGLTAPLQDPKVLPRVLPTTYEGALKTIREQASPAVGAYYSREEQTLAYKADGPVLALTSDGWVLAAGIQVEDLVLINNQRCIVDAIVDELRSGLTFAHCQGGSLPVVDLANGNVLLPGDQVFVLGVGGSQIFTRVQAITYGEEVMVSSDEPTRRIQLETDKAQDGSPVFTILSEVVGIVQGGEVIALEQIRTSLEQVLEGETELSYPSLGVTSMDLSTVVGVVGDIVIGSLVGTVAFGGSAADAGLLAGDVITHLDGVTIANGLLLSDLVSLKSPGEVIDVTFTRLGDVQTIEVTLGSTLD